MATATYTLTQDQLHQLLDYWHTLERTPEHKQVARYLRQCDLANGVDGDNNVNGLAPHSIDMGTGVVSIDTADTELEEEYMFFR